MGKDKKKKKSKELKYDLNLMRKRCEENTTEVTISDFNLTELPKFGVNINLKRHILEIKDTLKPIYRRLLMAMYDRGACGGGPKDNFAKCAAINGRVLEYYHPHGDASAHTTLIGMGQKFRNNVPLVEYHGNFGSAANPKNYAHMRYPQAKISAFAYDCYFSEWKPPRDLKLRAKDLSTDYIPNYADTCVEPLYLPCKYPVFLFNWHRAMGMGRSTGTVGFNLIEACKLVMALNENPLYKCEIYPDDPQGSTIVNMEDLKGLLDKGYDESEDGSQSTKVKVRSTYEIEETNGDTYIIVTSVPFETNPATVEEKIVKLAKGGALPEVADVYNDIGCELGAKVSLQIKVKKGYDPHVLMNKLYRKTDLAKSFSFKYGFVDGLESVDYTLRMTILQWLKYRRISILRFHKIKLRDISKRCHVLKAMINMIEKEQIEDVIKIIRKNKSEEGIQKLMKKFDLTDYQAQSIYGMKLSLLSSDNYAKYKQELLDGEKEFQRISKVIHDKNSINEIINSQMQECIDKYGTPRRSNVVHLVEKTLVAETEHILVITQNYIKKYPFNESAYNIGRIDKDDKVIKVMDVNNRDNLAVFTNEGKMMILPVNDISECSSKSNGVAFRTLKLNGTIVDVINVDTTEKLHLTSITANGYISNTAIGEIESATKGRALSFHRLSKGDSLVKVCESFSEDRLLVYTQDGKATLFDFEDIPVTSKNSVGIQAIKPTEGDNVTGVVSLNDSDEFLLVCTNRGYMKRFPIKLLPKSARNKEFEINSANGKVATVLPHPETKNEIYAYTSEGGYVVDLADISATSRLGKNDRVIELPNTSYLFDVK